MVNATGIFAGNSLMDAPSTATTTTAPALDSFAQQLSTALEQYFGQLESGANLQIDVQSNGSQTSGTSQFTVTVRDASSDSSASTTTPAATNSTAATTAATTTSTTSSTTSATSSTTSTTTTSPSTTTIDRSKMTPTDAYWAEQPPAVQALRSCPDDEKYSMAQDLAKQGYSIDMPIMVWGWDPLMTMELRQNEGYTWVPSAFQSNNFIGPGIDNVWNMPSYDPNNPPAGSIKVSTDFAKGTNIQSDPWYNEITQAQTAQAAQTS